MSAASPTETIPVPPLAPPIPRHPAVLWAVLASVALSFAVFGVGARAFIAAFAASVLVVLAAIDLEHRLLPNRILLPAIAIVLAAQIALFPERAAEWVLAGVGAAVFLAVPLIARRDAMGMGDIKLALLLGATVGWKVFYAIALGCLAMLPVALVMLAREGSIRGATLPFGPFLAFGTLVILFTS